MDGQKNEQGCPVRMAQPVAKPTDSQLKKIVERNFRQHAKMRGVDMSAYDVVTDAEGIHFVLKPDAKPVRECAGQGRDGIDLDAVAVREQAQATKSNKAFGWWILFGVVLALAVLVIRYGFWM